MIIWQGLGFLGLLIPLAFHALFYVAANKIFGEGYSASHGWPGSMGLFLSAAILWLLDFKLNEGGRTLIDPNTGQTVVLRKKHTLFWIPLRFIAIIVAVFAAIELVHPY